MPILSFIEVIIGFLPAVALETRVIKRLLKIDRSEAIRTAFTANAAAFFLALPLFFAAIAVFLVLVIFSVMGNACSCMSPYLEIFIFAIALLVPFPLPGHEFNGFLMLPMVLGPLILLFPTFLITLRCESFVLRRLHPEEDTLLVDAVSYKMNLQNFFLLAGIAIFFPLLL